MRPTLLQLRTHFIVPGAARTTADYPLFRAPVCRRGLAADVLRPEAVLLAGGLMSRLEESLALETSGDVFVAVADVGYEANTGMFGGWTAALLLKALLEQPESRGSACALTVNYIERVVPGERLLVRPAELGATRSLAHWRADLRRMNDNVLLATAHAVFALRRSSESAVGCVMPSVPAPDDIEAGHPPGAFGQRTETRTAYGVPPFGITDMNSLSWVRENSGRRVDAVQLAYLSDVYAPRVFHVSDGPRPSSTLTMSTQFLAGPEELSTVGDDYVLIEAQGTRIEQSLVGSRARLWSRQGSLLATSEQLCWFK